jgi:hypothetical protein
MRTFPAPKRKCARETHVKKLIKLEDPTVAHMPRRYTVFTVSCSLSYRGR